MGWGCVHHVGQQFWDVHPVFGCPESGRCWRKTREINKLYSDGLHYMVHSLPQPNRINMTPLSFLLD